MAQNGSAGGKKPSSNTLPELEYREKERGKNESKKQHNQNQNHHSSTSSSSSILPSADSKAQEMEYMENHVNSKRLSSSDLLGSTENLLKDEHSSSSCSSSSSNSNKNYKNASAGGGGGGGSSSPRGHGTANGSVPSSSGPAPSSSSKGDRKQKCGGGKNAAPHRDPVENCIPNNQLSKPEALVRLDPLDLCQFRRFLTGSGEPGDGSHDFLPVASWSSEVCQNLSNAVIL